MSLHASAVFGSEPRSVALLRTVALVVAVSVASGSPGVPGYRAGGGAGAPDIPRPTTQQVAPVRSDPPGPSSPGTYPILDPGTATATEPLNSDCLNAADPIARADELMANRYRLGAHPIVELPSNPRWNENPLKDANWQFQLHSMRYVLDLLTAARLTGTRSYEARALFLLHDWLNDNPRHGAPSAWAWNDHTTALRAIVLACVADLLPMSGWLHDALVVHGRTLADPRFYRYAGNHALNQDIGLLEIGRVLDRPDWRALAARRLDTLIRDSVDEQGVTNEQSIGYEDYNYRRYRHAEERLLAVGLTPGAAFARVDRMPAFLAQATLPNGTYEMIGDTSGWPAQRIPGTAAEYAATRGASGPKPTATVARYTAGFLFARSGWGERRPATDESFLSVKWGAAPTFHGHADGLSLTLAAYGSRLLVDPGPYSYGSGPARGFFKGRTAHNVVTVDGARWAWSTASRLLGYRQSAGYVDIRLQASGVRGVTHTRRVTYSRTLDYLLVEDRLTSSTVHTYRQLWHLVEDGRPTLGGSTAVTHRPSGNVLIRELAGAPTLRVVMGETAPIQGWISYKSGQMLPAPVVEATQRGTSVRYLTLIVPAEGRPAAHVSGLRLTRAGYSVTVTIGGHSELVTVSGSSIWIHALP